MYPRRSPIHQALESLNPVWGDRFGMPVALRVGDAEEKALGDLALCDLSALPRVGYKGKGTAAWLKDQGLACPADIYGSEPLDGGGLAIRVDTLEYFLEDGLQGGPIADLAVQDAPDVPGVYRVERQNACLLLSGARAIDVLAQTCGVNFAEDGGRLIRTRVAVTSCMVLQQDAGFRLWCEPSYGVYLWTVLLDIVTELGGIPVGLECVE